MQYKKRKPYKYKLHSNCCIEVDIVELRESQCEYLRLFGKTLLIKKGYTWDGASGAIDTKNIMLGALVHDALYQLIREGVIGIEDRDKCDKILQKICESEGMSKFRAWLVYKAVKRFGASAAKSRIITI
tara:strand:+ start:1935 stop:2321 length:387 start_codon:yes stop_codon:yes gene_type:complete